MTKGRRKSARQNRVQVHTAKLSKENAPNTWLDASPGDRVLSVVCFTVAPEMRGKGVAKALLDHACRYAEENGYDLVEGYPTRGDFSVGDCGGSASMYENRGFEIVEIPDGIVARKRTKKQSKKGQRAGMFGKNPAIK